MTTASEFLQEQKRLARLATEADCGYMTRMAPGEDECFVTFQGGYIARDVYSEEDAAFIAACYSSVPVMIAALEGVQALHSRDFVLTDYCEQCSDFGTDQYPPGQMVEYPCATAHAIEAAINTKENDDERN